MMTTRTNKTVSRLILAVLLLAGLSTWKIQAQERRVQAQDSTQPAQKIDPKVRALMEKVQRAYRQPSYLSFRVKYLYANEGQPATGMDSLAGEMEMDKNRCRFVIDGMETVLTDKYAIQIMNEDRAIYLSAGRHAAVSNPVSMLDSVLAHIDGVQTDLRQQGQSEVLTFRFPAGSPYSMVRIQVDTRTGYFQKISYSLFTTGLVAQELIDRPGHPGPYQSRGQIDIVFSRYEQGRFGDALFKEENFFNKTGGRFEPAGRYKDYHIFLASSNL